MSAGGGWHCRPSRLTQSLLAVPPPNRPSSSAAATKCHEVTTFRIRPCLLVSHYSPMPLSL